MKKSLATILLLAAQVGAQANEPQANAQFDPVQSFQKLIASATRNEVEAKVALNGNSKWVKQFYYVGEVKYDVKKTDSLVSPIVGQVSFPVEMRAAGPFERQDEAEAATAPTMRVALKYIVDGTYHVTNNAWRLRGFKYRDAEPASRAQAEPLFADEQIIKARKGAGVYHILEKWLP